MNYRHALIMPGEDMTTGAGTKVLNIDIDKPISRIYIQFKTTKALMTCSDAGPANIPRIELVDGSTVLHSLTGRENQALAYYSRPHAAMEHGQHIRGDSEVDFYALDFGRHLWDDQLAFLPNRFSNPQLKITYDENVADTSAEVNELEVWADIFDEKVINPIGFLMPVEHYSYTPGSDNSYETITLPEDRPIRQILVRAHSAGFEPWYTIDEARFDEGTLDRIPWEYTDLEKYYRRMKSVWPLIVTEFKCGNCDPATNDYYIPQTDYNAIVLMTAIGAGDSYVYETSASGAGGKLQLRSHGGDQHQGIARGYLPWHCFQFPMGKQEDINDWYDPTGKKPRLRLRASTGSTPTCQVVLEELYKY